MTPEQKRALQYEKYEMKGTPAEMTRVISDSLAAGHTSPAYFIRWLVSEIIVGVKQADVKETAYQQLRLATGVASNLVELGRADLLKLMCSNDVLDVRDGSELVDNVLNPIEELLQKIMQPLMPGIPIDHVHFEKASFFPDVKADTTQRTDDLLRSLDLPS